MIKHLERFVRKSSWHLFTKSVLSKNTVAILLEKTRALEELPLFSVAPGTFLQ